MRTRILPFRCSLSILGRALRAGAGLACLVTVGSAQCALQGNFTSRTTLPLLGSTAVSAVRSIDIDGDGRVDLAVRRSAAGLAAIDLLRNNGNGTFALSAGPGASQFEVADFDLDGREDLLVARSFQVPAGSVQHWQVAVEFWRNVTAGAAVGFVLADSRLLGAPALAAPIPVLGIADLDVDGIPDVAVRDRAEIHVVKGAGAAGVPAGAFGSGVVSPTLNGSMFHASLVDVDHDGALDFVAFTGSWLLVNHGTKDMAGRPNGGFGPTTTRQFGNAGGFAAVADLDADGWLDHVATSGNQVELRRGQPGFTFAAPVLVPISLGDMPFVADFDRDGTLEVCVPRTTQWWNGNVAFVDDPFVSNTVVTMEVGSGAPICGAALDLDGDGWLDFAIGKQNGEVVAGYNGCTGGGVPQVSVVGPNGGEFWLGGTQHTVQWTAASPVATFDVLLSTDAGGTWRPVARDVRGTSQRIWATEPGGVEARIRVIPSGLPAFGDSSDANFTIGPITLAAAQPFGQGCGLPGGLSANATPPRFGANSVVTVDGAVSGVLVAGWLSLPASSPIVIQPGCAIHLEPTFATVVAGAVAAANGEATLLVPVPVLPALAGLQVVVQPTAFVPAPLVLQIGNPVLLQLGF
jgi:hypothetical protein